MLFSCSNNWYLLLNGRTFNQYLATRPSRLVSTIKRRRRKLEAQHSVRVTIDVTPERVRDFIMVYELSWKRPEPYPDFIPTLATTCARLGVLRLGVLDVDGVPAAAQLWITTGRKSVIYKLAYDDAYVDFSVGSILSSEMFRYAMMLTVWRKSIMASVANHTSVTGWSRSASCTA